MKVYGLERLDDYTQSRIKNCIKLYTSFNLGNESEIEISFENTSKIRTHYKDVVPMEEYKKLLNSGSITLELSFADESKTQLILINTTGKYKTSIIENTIDGLVYTLLKSRESLITGASSKTARFIICLYEVYLNRKFLCIVDQNRANKDFDSTFSHHIKHILRNGKDSDPEFRVDFAFLTACFISHDAYLVGNGSSITDLVKPNGSREIALMLDIESQIKQLCSNFDIGKSFDCKELSKLEHELAMSAYESNRILTKLYKQYTI